ncbi:MAG TPA: lipopolysaccharide core heptose(II) kinase RfaY [Bacteroidia bacterium]|nr:lipopolysaccharide core heptose(II) kinase RfaY [Bacteroidia bacterium]
MFGFLKIHNFFLRLFRGMNILGIVFAYYYTGWIGKHRFLLFLVPSRFKQNGIIHSPQVRLRMMLEKLGPTFVKFGQILADRPDIISEKLRYELKKLQTGAEPFDHDIAMSLIESELSAPLEQVFCEFDYVCIGSASMGQVYRARLLNGDVVVVKVQRPHIKEKIKLDLQILEYIAHKISEEYPEFIVMNLEGIVQEFGETMRNELNYTNELANARRFGEMFRDVPHCKIPKVYEALSTSRLLVIEYIDGISPDDLIEINRRGLDQKQIAQNGVDVFLKMIFEHGFFHADPHAGNLFVLENNRIGLIDFGMVGSLKPSQMEFLAKFVRALDQKDGTLLCEAILLLNTNVKFNKVEDMEFSLNELMKKYKGVPYEHLKISLILDECFIIIRKYGVQIPASIFLLIKSIATIEKVGLRLDPSISISSLIRPYAVNLIKKQYSLPKIGEVLLRTVKKYLKLGTSLPDEISEILYNIKSGKLTHDIKLGNQEMFTRSIRQAGKTLALSILISFLIIGTSMIRAKGEGSVFIDMVFFTAVCFAIVLGFKLLSRLRV